MSNNKQAEILIVEDDPNDARLLMRVMRKSNLADKTLFMKDGAEALDFLFNQGSNMPKVIFLDLKMPRVDGIEFLSRLRSDSRTKQTPVVILTGSKEERDLKNAYSLGIASYVTKPIRFEQVASLMSELGLSASQ